MTDFALSQSQSQSQSQSVCLPDKLLLAIASTVIIGSDFHGIHYHILPLTALGAFKSKSKLLYDWRFTASPFVLASNPLRLTTSDFFFN
jgi:hypothetical protein